MASLPGTRAYLNDLRECTPLYRRTKETMKSTPITPEGKIRSERLTVPGGKKPLLRLYVDSAEPTTLLPFLIKALPDIT